MLKLRDGQGSGIDVTVTSLISPGSKTRELSPNSSMVPDCSHQRGKSRCLFTSARKACTPTIPSWNKIQSAEPVVRPVYPGSFWRK